MLRNFFAREELVGRNTEGQTLVEYALIIALVSIMLVVALGAMTDALETIFTTISDAITDAS